MFGPTEVSRRDFKSEACPARCDVEIVVKRLDADSATVAAHGAWLSSDELERARRCHFDRDRRRFVVARAYLRELLGERLGVLPEAVEFSCGEYGKPALGGRFAGETWQFNLSRCGELAIFALSASGYRVGVDVEEMREVRGAEEIAAHCFSLRERAAYRALAPVDQPLGFLNCWTRKEAFVKALGEGMSFAYDRFDVSLAPGEPARILRVDDRRGDESGWDMAPLAPALGYVAALVWERRPADFADGGKP